MALSPMMRQYLDLHAQYPDCLLLFRLGDFYELFFEDAKTASRELELTLTGRDCGLEERAPMCGVPYHSVNTYIEKLIEKGYQVAICEQMEDPALAKGLVDRQVIRVITAGTVTDPAMLEEKKNNYLASVCFQGRRVGLACVDVSTGEFTVMEPEPAALKAELARLAPTEIIAGDAARVRAEIGGDGTRIAEKPPAWYQLKNARSILLEHFHVSDLTPLGLAEHSAGACAAGAVLRYLRETQKNGLDHLLSLRFTENGEYMVLDANTARNLELTESLRGRGKKGTLLALLDRTCTAMGGRMLRSWVERPLIRKEAIEERLEAVGELKDDLILRESLAEKLTGVYDLERLVSKIAYQNLNPKDCAALCSSLGRIPEMKALLKDASSEALARLRARLDPLEDLTALLRRALADDPPFLLSEGGFIRDGYSAALDEYRLAQRDGKQWILDLEARERQRTGIKNLRVQYNKVFGYYIEVTKSNLALVPEDYVRKQTLVSAERFMTPELKETEQKIVGAQELSVRLELELFGEIRREIADRLRRIQETSEAVKTLDALLSLARAASDHQYVRPEITEDGPLRITEGRHPVVERTLEESGFVPNDTLLDTDENRMMIITGPNMAGKSTYMRQVALIALMAQIGSFVPATEASLPICDRIFTRVGASDDLASGQSTFMVEMSETAHILRNATARSLIILDEIGRGTSTFDGLAIAWAVVEYICSKEHIGAKTLFATHYHELSELEGHLEGVRNFCISVREHGEDVIFLRKIVRGGADKSFGVHVARLAGIPRPVIARAHEIQARLEVSNINQNTIGKNILGDGKKRKNEQVDLFEYKKTELIQELAEIDVMALTPMEAINKLFLLREKAKNV